MPPRDSFLDLLAHLQAGDQKAEAKIVNRFARRLVGLARSRLDKLIRRKMDPEDVVQSVFRSFFVRQAEGQWDMQGWDDLWTILTVITLRKCGHRIEYFHAARRDVRREAASDSSASHLQAIDREPTPEEAAMLAETLEKLMRSLTKRDRRILELRLQGETIVEIGSQVGCSENTVGRVLERARKRLERDYPQDDTPG